MNILWIKIGGLWPPDTGGRLRSFHLLSELSRRHRVTVATTHAPGEDPGLLAARLPRCRVVSLPYTIPKAGSARFLLALLRSWLSPLPVDLLKFRAPALREEIRRRLDAGDVDLCVADFLSATVNLPAGCPVPTLLFAHNVEHLIWKRLAGVERRPWRRLIYGLEWRKLRAAEARACRDATLTVAVSEEDAARLAALAPAAAVRAIPTGVDLDFFAPQPSRERPRALVFTGSMDWYPNEDAIRHFVREILPRIRAEIPDVSLAVVGRAPGAALRGLAEAAGATVTGRVEDIRPHLSEAAVFVVPLRIGGGTRLKIFEALAMGKAVVSTTVGAEGLPLEPGVHLLLADDAAGFAGAVVALLRDPARREALGREGRRLVEECFGWPKVAGELERRCAEAIAATRSTEGRAAEESAAGGRSIGRRLAARIPPAIASHARALLKLEPRHGLIYWRLRLQRFAGALLGGRRRTSGGGQTGAGDPGSASIGSVLYVCRGNIIRSPMAAALLRRSLAARGVVSVDVSSAGLYARKGQPADPRALAAARRFEIDLGAHRARRVTATMLARADRIVALDSLIEAELRGRYPEAAARVVMLEAARGRRPPRPIDIPDPYDGDEEDVLAAYELLRPCVGAQADGLFTRDRPRESESRACV